MPKFCPGCGFELPENVKFCPECGEKFLAPYEVSKVQDMKKKNSIKFILKLVGLFSILAGFLIILAVYSYPFTIILGQEFSLAQLHSLCGNPLVNALSSLTTGSCTSVHDYFYFSWGIAVILLISGTVEVISS